MLALKSLASGRSLVSNNAGIRRVIQKVMSMFSEFQASDLPQQDRLSISQQSNDRPTTIAAVNLTRTFGQKVAVNDLHLQVERGEFFGFLGPNGAGKSTTIKMLTGLLRPTRGTAFVA